VGGRGDDLLSGKFGDDILVGGMGSDTLEGGSGADLFVLNSVAESPVGGGRDRIVDFSQGEDKIDLSRLAVAGKADGAFTLIGTASFSQVAGELRQFDDANGIVVEGDVDGDGAADFQIAVHTPGLTLAPEDFVGLSATVLALASSGPSLMQATTTLDGTEEVTHLGSPVKDHLIGTDGADVMDGAEDNDTLRGKAGNDSLHGGDGDDTLYGAKGDDLLVGGAGNDLLNGGNGDDVLIGGFGHDGLTGGSRADTFVFETTVDSLPGADNRDTIEDFSRKEGDKIDLSAIDADVNTPASDSFVFIEKAGFSGSAGELRYFVNGQGHAVVDGDTDGDAESDFQFLVADTSLLTLDDFTL
jgi:Ca2+-binding RTX toxin-like protein